jgi:uncharacterized protein (TIGR02284 family)
MNIDKVKNELREILNIVEDGSNGYRSAAQKMRDSELKTIFNRLSQQRKLFREELENDARDLGLDMEPSGTAKGYFHRIWLDLRSSLSSKEDEVLIEEAMRGEETALKVYDSILRHNELPEYIQDRLGEQRKMIQGSLYQLEEFERSMA